MGSWTGTLPTLAAGDTITDTVLIGDIIGILTALTDDWTPYTPVWTAASSNPSIGDGTIVGASRQLGSTLDVIIGIGAGSTTTFGTGQYDISLPAGIVGPSALPWVHAWGYGVVVDTSAADYYVCSCGFSGSGGARIRPTGDGNLTGTSLIALTNGDLILARLQIEVT